VVDWYYIFLILSLRVYPCSPDIYNVVKLLNSDLGTHPGKHSSNNRLQDIY
jgi:hypothetical protein